MAQRRGRRRRVGGRSDRPAARGAGGPADGQGGRRSSWLSGHPGQPRVRARADRSPARRSSSTPTATSSTTRWAARRRLGGAADPRAQTERGFLDPGAGARAIRPSNIHLPVTGLVCLENTHNRHGGHLLHARGDRGGGRRRPTRPACPCISTAPASSTPRWRSSARSRTSPGRWTRSPSACPRAWARRSARSCAARRDFIARARRVRKMLGGGHAPGRACSPPPGSWRSTPWSSGSPKTTRTRAAWPRAWPRCRGLRLDLAKVQTNIVILPRGPRRAAPASSSPAAWRARSRSTRSGPAAIRCVTHKDVDAEDIDRALDAFREITARLVAEHPRTRTSHAMAERLWTSRTSRRTSSRTRARSAPWTAWTCTSTRARRSAWSASPAAASP